jgi:hypothetical protein
MSGKPYTHHLHQYKYLWRACTQRETIISAWKKLRKGKTKRPDVIEIESKFDYYVDLMTETIKNTKPDGDQSKAFKPAILTPTYRREYNKIRETYSPPIWDQWVHHIIVKVIERIIMKHLYKYSCGSIPKRGGIYGKRQIERVLKKGGFKYFAKIDIRHFFNSTRLDILIRELSIFIDDDWFLYLIRVVYTQFTNGLPLGFYLTQWLENFVLNRVDWYIKLSHPKLFIRYVDDIIFADNNKKWLHNMIENIKKILGKLRLKLKGNYQVIRFEYKKKNGKTIGRCIDFMGFVFKRNRTILRERILLNSTKIAYRIGKIKNIALKQAQSMLSRIGWFKNTSTKKVLDDLIMPNISIKSLKNIVSKYQRRYNDENGMDKGTVQSRAFAIRAA